MAALVCRNGLMMCAMAVMALLSVGVGGVAGRVVEPGCPEIEYVYPFQSTCQKEEAAEFGTEYHLVSPFSNERVALGGLTPSEEGDNKVRFTGDKADEGARYVLKAVASKNAKITPGTRFTIQNVVTKKFFAYEFTDELFPSTLYEAHEMPGVAIAEFKLDVACDVPLPCPSTYGARCLSYLVTLAEYGTSIFPMHHNSFTYVGVSGRAMLGSHTLPLLLRRVKYPDTLAKRPSA